MFKKLNDLEYGFLKEKEILPILQSHFNDDSIHKLNQNNEFDFKGDNKYIELKSRRNIYNKYSTTMIGLNKFDRALTLSEEIYFVFSFDDGLYYYKFNKENKFEIKQGDRRDRGRNEIKDYVFIPIESLLKIL